MATASAHRFAKVQDALAAIRAGRMVILVDDAGRENEGDLVMAAEKVTPEAINFMASEARGLICLSLTAERLRELDLPLMVTDNTSSHETAFTVSIDARTGISTGISAPDRAHTIRLALNPSARPGDFSRPGHVFPLRARDGGVLVRSGHTEGAVDLARLAGLTPSGVICEIMNRDGTMARMPELEDFASRHSLVILSIADLIDFRLVHESLVRLVEETALPTRAGGTFHAKLFESPVDGQFHLALIKGELSGGGPVLVRVHQENILEDVFGSVRNARQSPLDASLRAIADEGKGVLVYLGRRGSGQQMKKRIQAFAREDRGEEAPPATGERAILPEDPAHPGLALRHVGIGAQILATLGVRKMRLLTNHPRPIIGLDGYGLEIVETVPIPA